MTKDTDIILDLELLEQFGSAMGAHGVAVYICLLAYCDEDGTAFCSMEHIAHDLGTTRKTIAATIRKLATLGLITIEKYTGARGYQYRITDPAALCALAIPND